MRFTRKCTSDPGFLLYFPFPLFLVMNMMYNTTGSGLILFWGLHVVSVLVFGIGVALLLFWAFKKLSERDLWKWGWILVIVGTILCLLTVPAWSSFGMGRFGSGLGRTGYGMMPMMDATNGQISDEEKASQSKEEADGKALYDKLQRKESTCADLFDSDFELIGEYFMGQQSGVAHIQMNAMMKQMMGTQGEEEMHALIGENKSGCLSAKQSSSQSNGGMMNGEMMRRFNNSSPL